MADLNLQEIHDFMIQVAQQAADRITSAAPTTDTSGSKKNCTSSHPRLSITTAKPAYYHRLT